MANETVQIFRSVGVLILGFAAAFGGMIARERVSLTSNESALNSLVASKEGQPIPEDDYFTELASIIEKDYVETKVDKMKLATGAVRGMIGSLEDLNSIYFEKDDFDVVMRSFGGQYEGVGVDLAFQFPTVTSPAAGKGSAADSEPKQEPFPRVVVLSVVPGGPADLAGLKAGDWVDTVDGRWVVNSMFIAKAQSIAKQVQEKKLPQSALNEIRREIRSKFEDAIPPMRAWKRLMTGQSGEVKLKAYRGTELLDFNLKRGKSRRIAADSYTRLSFAPGTKSAFGTSGTLKIDLRGMSGGDFKTATNYLSGLGVNEPIGQLKRKERTALPVTIKSKASKRDVTILVDKQTRGVPEIFALAMKRSGANIQGQTGGSPVATEVAVLPDGSGFTLNLGTFVGGAK